MELTVKLDPNGELPMYEQLCRFVMDEIQNGRMDAGAKLPSKRNLCQHLKISRATVETAYGILLAEGYIRSVPKSGYYVQPVIPMVQQRKLVKESYIAKQAVQKYQYEFSTSAVDTTVFPYATWAKIFKETIYARPDLLQRGAPQGDEELRQELCDFLYQYRGVHCEPEQMIIGAGMEYLLDMLLQLLDIKAVIALEDPGYAASYRIMENHGRKVLPIPVDEKGMRIDELAKSCAQIAYVTPSHQFPMGAAMPIGRRMQLLSWADQEEDRFLIEDDYDSEFRYATRPIPALQGLSANQKVIYIGTFSRSIAPSIRVAYMVLPNRLLGAYHQRFGTSASTVSRFEQQTLYRFIQGGHYGRHLRRVGNLYRARCTALTQGLEQVCGMQVLGNQAGLHLLAIHPGLTEAELVSRATDEGIRVMGLSRYCRCNVPFENGLVMGFAGMSPEEIGFAIRKLKKAWG